MWLRQVEAERARMAQNLVQLVGPPAAALPRARVRQCRFRRVARHSDAEEASGSF